MRKIKIYSTATGIAVVDSNATNWGQLKNELTNKGYSVSDMTAVENKNNSNLELDEAVLPDGEFVLMLAPKKTKSGGLSYSEIRLQIKQAFEDDKKAAHEHFNAGNKNYTNKSKDELEALLLSWKNESEDDDYEEEYVEDNYDNEDEEDESHLLESAINTLRFSNEYKARKDDFELAFDLINGHVSAATICESMNTKSDLLTDAENEWISKMKGKI
jgi:hypothetical protein